MCSAQFPGRWSGFERCWRSDGAVLALVGFCRLAEVRHGTTEFCDFDVEIGGSLLFTIGMFQKSDVVQTYPLEAICGG